MITFKELSTPLKIATISAWIYATTFIIAFLTGLITGLIE